MITSFNEHMIISDEQDENSCWVKMLWGEVKEFFQKDRFNRLVIDIAKNAISKASNCKDNAGNYNHEIMCIVPNLIWLAEQIAKGEPDDTDV